MPLSVPFPRMTTVLHVIDEHTAEDMLEQLALLRGGEAVACIGPPPAHLPFEGPVQQVHCPLGVGRLAGPGLARLAKRANILHAWSFLAARASCAAARRLRKHVVLSLPHAPRGDTADRLRSLIRSGVTFITVPTKASREAMLAAGVPDRAVEVMPPPAAAPADTDRRRAHVREELAIGDLPLIVAPHAMTPAGGHKYALWAYAIVRKMLPPARMIFPTTTPFLPRVRFFAETTGYLDEILFTGRRFARDDLLSAADVAVFFHERDDGVASLVAAMAAGIAIAASDTPDAAECLDGWRCGLRARPSNPQTAAAALLRLLEEPDLARRLADAARRRAQEVFGVQASRRRLRDIYRRFGSAPLPPRLDAPLAGAI